MKKQLPIILGMVIGIIAVAEFYVPASGMRGIKTTLEGWALVLAAAAFVLGAINIVQVNYPKIRRMEPDWPYKVVLLACAAVMMLTGVAWHTFGGERANGSVKIAMGGGATAPMIKISAARDLALIQIGNDAPLDAATWRKQGGQVAVKAEVETPVRVFMPPEVKGYEEYNATILLHAGEVATVKTDLVMRWGKEGRVHTWLYDHIFAPCNATMFALLAFFIASAAFRAFRMRNTEAALLLGSAILVMIGSAPVGGYISDFFPDLRNWILSIPNNAGRRAIMIGAALGAVVTGLRVILGLERSHLGSD